MRTWNESFQWVNAIITELKEARRQEIGDMARTRNPTIYLLQHYDGSFKLNPWTGVLYVFMTQQEAEQYRTAEYTCTEFRLIKVPNQGQGVQQDDSEHNSVPNADW